jgi:periplasmic divalent cation tolerance protein
VAAVKEGAIVSVSKESDILLAYVTTKDVRQARRIGRAVVTERLAACVNIVGNMNSLYWWDGKVQDDREAILIAKTTAALKDRLLARIRQLHS